MWSHTKNMWNMWSHTKYVISLAPHLCVQKAWSLYSNWLVSGVLKQRDRNFDNGKKKKKKKERRNGKKKMGSLVHLTRCEKFLVCSRAGHYFPGCVYRSIYPCLPFFVPQTFCLTQHAVPWPFAMSSEGTKAQPKWLHLYQITKQGTSTGPHYRAASAVLAQFRLRPHKLLLTMNSSGSGLVWEDSLGVQHKLQD